jgi:hypothetical protein
MSFLKAVFATLRGRLLLHARLRQLIELALFFVAATTFFAQRYATVFVAPLPRRFHEPEPGQKT